MFKFERSAPTLLILDNISLLITTTVNVSKKSVQFSYTLPKAAETHTYLTSNDLQVSDNIVEIMIYSLVALLIGVKRPCRASNNVITRHHRELREIYAKLR